MIRKIYIAPSETQFCDLTYLQGDKKYGEREEKTQLYSVGPWQLKNNQLK